MGTVLACGDEEAIGLSLRLHCGGQPDTDGCWRLYLRGAGLSSGCYLGLINNMRQSHDGGSLRRIDAHLSRRVVYDFLEFGNLNR